MTQKLQWQAMPAVLPGIQGWSARDGFASFVITQDKNCRPDDPYFGRFAASAKLGGGRRLDLGVHDTSALAKAAAETSRSQSSQEREG